MRMSTLRSIEGDVCVRASSTRGSTTLPVRSQKSASSSVSDSSARCALTSSKVSGRTILSGLLECGCDLLHRFGRAVGVLGEELYVLGRRSVTLGRVLERVAHVAAPHLVKVEVLRAYLLGSLRDHDALAGYVLTRITSPNL